MGVDPRGFYPDGPSSRVHVVLTMKRTAASSSVALALPSCRGVFPRMVYRTMTSSEIRDSDALRGGTD